MNDNLINLLQNLWLSKKEAKIFIFLYKYWKKPASTIAKAIWDERTNTYKTLKKLVKNWFISEIKKDWTTLFFVHNKDIFKHKIEAEFEEIYRKKENLQKLNEELEKIEKESSKEKPSIVSFEWADWIKNLYNDIINICKEKWYKLIKFFASNTLENKWTVSFENYYPEFFNILKKNWINLETFLWNGIELLEEIVKTDWIELSKLPAWNSAIQVFVFGDYVYIIIFKQIPYWIKIESEEFANFMHFMFNLIWNLQNK